MLLHSLWDIPWPEIEPVSLALAGNFFTTEPPGKPLSPALFKKFILAVALSNNNSFLCLAEESSVVWTIGLL